MPLPTNTGSGDNTQKQKSGQPMLPSQNDNQDQAPVGYPAPRGGLPAPTSPLQRPVAPAPPPPDEFDPFEQLSIEETVDETEIYEEPYQESHREPEPQNIESRERESIVDPLAASSSRTSNSYDEESEESEFINKKNRKLIPFGGAKSKQEVVNDGLANKFDAREDRRTKARIVQIGALTALFGIVGFGGYNSLNPPKGVNANEMNSAISAAIATQNFPVARGTAFAEDFLSDFLVVTPNSDANEMLGYYYTGVLGGSGVTANIEANNVGQNIIIEPKVFKVTPLNADSAAFEVGALVEPTGTLNAEDNTTLAEEQTLAQRAKWVFYNVNVYYDVKTDTMAVTPDSPSLIPNANFGSSTEIPEEKLLGTGKPNKDTDEAVRTALFGYLEAFAKSSASNHDSLDQYLISGGAAKPELTKGLDDKFQFAGTPEEAVQFISYDTGDVNVTKIDVIVRWAV